MYIIIYRGTIGLLACDSASKQIRLYSNICLRCVADSLLRVYNRFSSNTHFPQQLNSYCSSQCIYTIREKFSPALDKTKHTQYCENKRKENDYTMNV